MAVGLVAVILVAVLGGQLAAPKEASSAGVADTHVPESIPTLRSPADSAVLGRCPAGVVERRTSRGSPHRSGHRGPGRGPHGHAHHQPLQCRRLLRGRYRRDRGRARCLSVPAQGTRPCRTGHSDGDARPRRRRPRLPRPAQREPDAATDGRATPFGGLDARTGPVRRRLARATAGGRGNAAVSGPSAIAVRVWPVGSWVDAHEHRARCRRFRSRRELDRRDPGRRLPAGLPSGGGRVDVPRQLRWRRLEGRRHRHGRPAGVAPAVSVSIVDRATGDHAARPRRAVHG